MQDYKQTDKLFAEDDALRTPLGDRKGSEPGSFSGSELIGAKQGQQIGWGQNDNFNANDQDDPLVAQYIAALSQELVRLAVNNKMQMVAYFLQMARQEALSGISKDRVL